MSIETIAAIAMLCSNQYPGYQQQCARKYVRCMEEEFSSQMKINLKPDEGVALTACVLRHDWP